MRILPFLLYNVVLTGIAVVLPWSGVVNLKGISVALP